MAFVECDFLLPQYPHYGNHQAGKTTEGLGSGGSSRAKAMIIQVPKTGNLYKVGFILWTVTSAQDLRISFRDVDTAGDPTGADVEYRDLAAGSQVAGQYVETGIMSDDGTDTGNLRAVTQGDWVAIVWDYVSTDGNATLLTNFMYGYVQSVTGQVNVPYMAQDVSSWSRINDQPCFTLKYDDDELCYVYPTCFPSEGRSDHIFANNSSPDEVGVRFQLPIRVKVSGVWLHCSGAADIDIVLYEDNDTVIDTITVDKDADSQQTGQRLKFHWFSDRHELSKDTWYRLAIKPTTTTDTQFASWLFDSNGTLKCCGVPGVNWYHTSRTDAGSWTNDTARRFIAGGFMVAEVFV